jgi:hypothetical protein
MSGADSPYKLYGLGRRKRGSLMTECPQDRLEHHVQFPAHIFRKEAQHQVAVLLQQLVLASVATVRDRIREMLRAVQLHRHTGISTQEIHFQLSKTIERDRQHGVDAEAALTRASSQP